MDNRDSITTWPTDAYKTVLRSIPFASKRVLFRETCNGTNTFSHAIPSSYQLVISYYYTERVFVVWNAAIHHHIHDRRGMTTLSIGADARDLINAGLESSCIERSFKSVKQKGTKDCVEMITIVGVDAVYDFCKDYQEYILPQLSAIPTGKTCLYSTPSGKLQRLNSKREECYQIVDRERELITRAKRDPQFRENVIARWGGRCIVCGTKERRILEAAHIDSVKQGGSDDPINGYCLCANHHRMYDSGILDIKVEDNSFFCNSDESKEMPWFKDAEKRGFTLFLPNK